MPAALSWIEGLSDTQQSATIESAEDLDRVLDHATNRAVEIGTPFNVVLECRVGESLEIVVGREASFVQWTRLEPWKCLGSATNAPEDEDDLVVFAGHGQYSEMPRYLWIETNLARDAVRQYFASGEVTDAVRWVSI